MKYIDSRRLDKNSFILDVRTTEEINSIHLATLPFISKNSETIDISKFIDEYKLTNEKTTINILCYSGKRAEKVANKFIKYGYNNVRVVKGGIQQAEKDGIKIINNTLL